MLYNKRKKNKKKGYKGKITMLTGVLNQVRSKY